MPGAADGADDCGARPRPAAKGRLVDLLLLLLLPPLLPPPPPLLLLLLLPPLLLLLVPSLLLLLPPPLLLSRSAHGQMTVGPDRERLPNVECLLRCRCCHCLLLLRSATSTPPSRPTQRIP